MLIQRGYKTELGPNNKQRSAFLLHSDAARFAYNWGLARRKEYYAETGKTLNFYALKREFNGEKQVHNTWLYGANCSVTTSALRNMDRAYQNFFRRVREGSNKPGFPRFKSRHRGVYPFRLYGTIRVGKHAIRLPSIGWIRLKETDYLPRDQVKILSATVSERAGHWYVSLQVAEERTVTPAEGPALGVDLGISALATCSDGTVYENPKATVRYERKLRRLNKELARRKRGSQNWRKAKAQLAETHRRIANLRLNSTHDATHDLIEHKKPSMIVIEDLNVSGMVQNRHLARAISDVSMREFRRQIEYKAVWNGVAVETAGRFFPSSKQCSECGNVKRLLKLSERIYVCESCGAVLDRDLNAARNLAKLAVKPTESINACGEDVSHLVVSGANLCEAGTQS